VRLGLKLSLLSYFLGTADRKFTYIKGSGIDVGADIFRRGLCLPSDNKMTEEQQDRIIEIIHRCFL
jgi:dTDP-4-amino-4,6-dideoxygalactose transaminase